MLFSQNLHFLAFEKRIYKTRVIPNNVCIVISTQFNLNCIFRIDLIHLQQKSLQEYVKTITFNREVLQCCNVSFSAEDESNRFEIYSLN